MNEKLSYCKYCRLPKHQCHCTSGEWSADYRTYGGKIFCEEHKNRDITCDRCNEAFRQNCKDDAVRGLEFHQHKWEIDKLAGFIKTGIEGVYIICRNCGEVRLVEVNKPTLT